MGKSNIIICLFLFVNLSAGSRQYFALHDAMSFNIDSSVLVNDLNQGREASYKIVSEINIYPVWGNSTSELWMFQLSKVKLQMRPKTKNRGRNASYSNRLTLFDHHLEKPFFAIYHKGDVNTHSNSIMYLHPEEHIDIINYKKSLANLFQFQLDDGVHREEYDISGVCMVTYEKLSSNSIRKIKRDCRDKGSEEKEVMGNGGLPPSVSLASTRITRYVLSEDLSRLTNVYSEEVHTITVDLPRDVGLRVRAWHRLDERQHTTPKTRLTRAAAEETLEGALKLTLAQEEINYSMATHGLHLHSDSEKREDIFHVTLEEVMAKVESTGEAGDSRALLAQVPSVRSATKEALLLRLNSISERKQLLWLCDVYGSAHTLAAHSAIVQHLRYDDEQHREPLERYITSLSLSPRPNAKIIMDVLKASENKKTPDQISESLLLAASSMAYTLTIVAPNSEHTQQVSSLVKETTLRGLSKCRASDTNGVLDPCLKYFRALGNLRIGDTLQLLLEHSARDQGRRAEAALDAIESLLRSGRVKYLSDEDSDRLHTLALGAHTRRGRRSPIKARSLMILLQAAADGRARLRLREVLRALTSDSDGEVCRLLLQTLKSLTGNNQNLENRLSTILAVDKAINNWHSMAPSGRSSAITRLLHISPSFNVSLESVQLLKKAMLSRGRVLLQAHLPNDRQRDLITLSMYAEGLSSFAGGGDVDEGGEDDEGLSVDIQVSVGGVQLRPVRLFGSQSELLGHVWAGTASESTPIIQGVVPLLEGEGVLPLCTGSWLRWGVRGALSLDLLGQVQVSLWNRAATSLIELKGGVSVQSAAIVGGSWGSIEAHSIGELEPRLMLDAQLDFYDDPSICLQLMTDDTKYAFNVTKSESIKDESQSWSRRYEVNIPGHSYHLDRLNGEMCTRMHSTKS